MQHFDLLCSCDCKFDERLCCLGWLLVVHTGNLNINPCSPVCIFLICVCGRIAPLDTAKFSDLTVDFDQIAAAVDFGA